MVSVADVTGALGTAGMRSLYRRRSGEVLPDVIASLYLHRA